MADYSAGKLADLVGGSLVGNADLYISGVSDLRNATAEQVSFLGNDRYLPLAKKTAAGVLILSRDVKGEFPGTQIRVDSPSLAFSTIAALFAPEPVNFQKGIHPSAVIAADAVIGKEVTIQAHVVVEAKAVVGNGSHLGAGSYIGHETVIGEGSFIYPRVTIRERCRIGNRVIVHSGAVIGSDGFGYEFKQGKHIKVPQTGCVQIDDDVEIGANTTIDRGRFDRTWIQEGAKIDNLVMIAHNVVVGKHSVVVAQVGISGSSSLGQYVTLAGQAGLVGHIHVGDRATVTAQSGISKDVPPGSVVAGHHAVPLKESLKIEASLRRLPELIDRVRALEKKSGGDGCSAA